MYSFLRASCRIRTNDPEITNHVLWPTELKRRVGKLTISRRYNQLPLLRSSPGGFEGSWPYGTYPCLAVRIRHTPYPVAGAKVDIFFEHAIHFMKKKRRKAQKRPGTFFISRLRICIFRLKTCISSLEICISRLEMEIGPLQIQVSDASNLAGNAVFFTKESDFSCFYIARKTEKPYFCRRYLIIST